MYICQRCQKSSKPRETMNKKVTHERAVTYVTQSGTIVSTGHEIAREITICSRCLDGWDENMIEKYFPQRNGARQHETETKTVVLPHRTIKKVRDDESHAT